MPSNWPKKSDMPNMNVLRQRRVRYPGQLAPDEIDEIEYEKERRRLANEAAEAASAARAAASPIASNIAMNPAASVVSVETRGGGVPLHSGFNPGAREFRPPGPQSFVFNVRGYTFTSEPGEKPAVVSTPPAAPASVASTIMPKTEHSGNYTAPTNMALVVARKVKTTEFLFDDMGTEIVRLEVSGRDNQAPQTFSVHRNLLVALGGRLATEFARGRGDVRQLQHTSTSAVKMLIEYAYKRVVIKTKPELDKKTNIGRLVSLCHFYAFAEAYMLDHSLRNEIIDAIQDGFARMNSYPQAGFCKIVYGQTTQGSVLRKFFTAGVLAHHRNPRFSRDCNLSVLLKANDEFREDFLDAVENFDPGVNPMVREVTAEMEQAGYVGPPMSELREGMRGLPVCQFHLHRSIQSPDEGNIGGGGEENGPADYLLERCHFFPEK